MPEYADQYRRAILTARNQVLNPRGVPKEAYQGLMQLYARMISDINRDLGVGRITPERAEALENLIIRRFNDLGDELGVLFARQKRSVAEVAANGHAEAVERAASAADVTGLSVSFNTVPDEALETMMLRRGLTARNFQSVIKRNLLNAADDIDQYLRSAVGRGVSADRAAKELAGILSRNNDDVLGLVNDGRLMKSNINRALREGDINMQTYKQASQVLFDSRRIMVSEINTAYRESDLLSQDRSPIVGASKWQVSGRHYGLPSSPDVCTIYHETDQFGLGTGVFPTKNVPSTPHPFCLPADSLVSPRGRVKSVSKRWFDGDVFIIHTASGKELTCTPNHPVLTDRGFIDADSLNVGDKVINDTIGKGEPVTNGNNIDKPTPIHKIVESFLNSGKVSTRPVPNPSVDLNGYRADRKVGIIGSNRFLGSGIKSMFDKSIMNSEFIFGDISAIQSFFLKGLGSLALFFHRNISTLTGFMSRLDLLFAFLFRHIRPDDLSSLAGSSNFDSVLFKPFTDSAPTNIEFFRQSLLRHAGIVERDDFIDRKVHSTGHNDGILAYQILNGEKEPIEFDEIVKIETKEYHDYVYNIETTERYYFANGVATHNCGCHTEAVIMDPENWGTGGAALREPSDLREEQFRSMFSDKTDRHLERQLEVANKYQRLAYQVAQGFGQQAA